MCHASLFKCKCALWTYYTEFLTSKVTCCRESFQLVFQPFLLQSQDFWFPLNHSFYFNHHSFLSILQSLQNAWKTLLYLRLRHFRSSLQAARYFFHVFGGLRDNRDFPFEFVCELRNGLCLFVYGIGKLGVFVTLCWVWRHGAFTADGLLAAFTVVPAKVIRTFLPKARISLSGALNSPEFRETTCSQFGFFRWAFPATYDHLSRLFLENFTWVDFWVILERFRLKIFGASKINQLRKRLTVWKLCVLCKRAPAEAQCHRINGHSQKD